VGSGKVGGLRFESIRSSLKSALTFTYGCVRLDSTLRPDIFSLSSNLIPHTFLLPPQTILLGLRGSGKSTLGKLLAARLITDFVDLDIVTAGLLRVASAAEAIHTLGLPAFRDAEVRALQMPRCAAAGVLALGGGTPTAHGAIPALSTLRAKGARLVYLRGTPDTLRSRLSATDLSTRPSLTGASVLDEIERLFAERDPLYRSLADNVVEIDGRSIDESVDDLAAALRKPLVT